MKTSKFGLGLHKVSSLTLAAALSSLCTAALAQATVEVTKSACAFVGANSNEPAGDRDGHVIQVANYSCKVQGGGLDGAITTGQAAWDHEGLNATAAYNVGVVRKPGGLAVFSLLEGRRTLIMKEGKVVGYTSSGSSKFTTATGTLSSYSGKSFSWTVTPASAFEFVIDTKTN